jgi:hypothetical protein
VMDAVLEPKSAQISARLARICCAPECAALRNSLHGRCRVRRRAV